MSANVWFEEVDTGLVEEIKNTVRVKNADGVSVALDNENGVIVRKPEEDLKFETFPCVSIYNKTYKPDLVRFYPYPVMVQKGSSGVPATMEDPALPFNLTYQIDFWARYQEDMNEMTKSWLSKHYRTFNLNVVDDGGTKRSCNVMQEGDIVKSDLVQGKNRLYHSIITYTIWVELDSETRYNVPIVVSRDIDTTQKEGGK